jgi:hypothetical protein
MKGSEAVLNVALSGIDEFISMCIGIVDRDWSGCRFLFNYELFTEIKKQKKIERKEHIIHAQYEDKQSRGKEGSTL